VADRAHLNRADWYAVHHFSTPYPGDTKILTPDEVPNGPAGNGDADG
jgi:hypothetical protein